MSPGQMVTRAHAPGLGARAWSALGALAAACAQAGPAKDFDTRILSDTGACVVVTGDEAALQIAANSAIDDELFVRSSQGSGFGSGLDVQFLVDPNIAKLPGWLDALAAAALVYEQRLADPVVITVRVSGVASGGSIAWVTTPRFALPYAGIRAAMVADASGRESMLLANLPAGPVTFETEIGPRTTVDTGGLRVTAPQARALGLVVALPPGDPDTTMTFNLSRTFDLNPSDGIDPSAVDFRYVIVHELGHVLGFITGTDASASLAPTAFDLFRFGNGLSSVADPQTLADFASFPREIRRGFDAAVDTVGVVVGAGGPWPLSLGIIGDGRQASHWKDESLLGVTQSIGVMDPTYNNATTFPGYPTYLSTADRLAFSLMGWDVAWFGPCPDDLTGDGLVNSNDLSILLGNWGPCPVACAADITGDGLVNSDDLAALLGGWGACE